MPASPELPRFFNRELSWLEFNQRVLDEALNPDVPPLERLKFLAITASNLDEFFMVRVGGLKILSAAGVTTRDPAGLTPREQLDRIGERTRRMVRDQYACFQKSLEPELAAAGIRRVDAASLTAPHRCHLEAQFNPTCFSVLTPLAIQPDTPVPLLAGLVLHVVVRLEPREDRKTRLAVLPLGQPLPRFLPLPGDARHTTVLLEDAVRASVGSFFPGETVLETAVFRLTRNADLSVQNEDSADFLAEMQQVLDARRQSRCVRLEVEAGASAELVAELRRLLDVEEADVYAVPGPLALSDFLPLTSLEGFDDLRDKPWPPQSSLTPGSGVSIFDVLDKGDILLVHPYDGFAPVLALVEEAAADPQVLAIKQILYRTSRNSRMIAALRRAAENGKYVTAVVELKARFDEARNMDWARELERTGVKVFYGVKDLKTHAKVCLVVRKNASGIGRYAHFGTGNYNEATARLYTDVSYLTANPDLTSDAASFFNAITGYSQPIPYRKLAAAPTRLRARILELIESEAERARQGQPARIEAKINSLVDRDVIEALYAASQAGVTIRLNVRGICCLRPGVPGLSERISVLSVVDRFLEHARIFRFLHGGDEQVYLSSADWMRRNLDRRIELMVPVDDPACRKSLLDVLETGLQDSAKGRVLQADGTYQPVRHGRGQKALRSQKALYDAACRRAEDVHQAKRTVFEPHRPPDA
jgi:polyphosphate kinase